MVEAYFGEERGEAPLHVISVSTPENANALKGSEIVTVVEGLHEVVASTADTVYVPAGRFDSVN